MMARHALRPDVAALADQVVKSTGAPGWCGVSGDGVLTVYCAGPERIGIRLDGRPLKWTPAGATDRMTLSDRWPRARQLTVMAAGHHLIGSPISLRAIGRVEGHVETTPTGVRGWAWCPGDPDSDPRLTIEAGEGRRDVIATEAGANIPGLVPFARPRSFAVGRAEFPAGAAPIHLRGRDGRELPGSPVPRSESSTVKPPNPEPAANVTAHRRADLARWRPDGAGSVIIVTHNDGGGVERRVQAAVASHVASGRNAIVLRPTNPPGGVILDANGLPRLRFELPREQSRLLRLLRGANPVAVELHHFLNHDPSIFQTIVALGVPYDIHVHDFAWFCPRVALVGRGDRYCGEPAPAVCEVCVAETGGFLHEDIPVAALLERSRNILAGARRIIAPSRDAAARMERHFPGVVPVVVNHEDDAALNEPPPIAIVDGTVRVCVVGAIGLHKGYHVLLGCARDARERALELTFVVAGTTIDDQRLMDTGRVFVTGPYQPDEAVALIQSQNAALALLPSIWPETWCLGLTELWAAGLRVAAFDIGAPAERIRQTGRGFLLPLELSPPRINDALLNAARGRSFLPIRRSSAYKPSQ
jgi:glycosyltransferase involved in cell wall biosynthesis